MQIYFCVPGRSFLFIYHSISGYRTKCVDKKQYPPAKGCNGNRLRLPSPHRDIFRAALMLALRKYWGFGCSLMHSFCEMEITRKY